MHFEKKNIYICQGPGFGQTIKHFNQIRQKNQAKDTK